MSEQKITYFFLFSLRVGFKSFLTQDTSQSTYNMDSGPKPFWLNKEEDADSTLRIGSKSPDRFGSRLNIE